jgi:diguanylate cyclase (GGDEF)-like protein
MENLNIRTRLALLIIVSALPAFGLSVYTGLERRAQAEVDARADLARFAALAATRQEEVIEGARQLLFAVAGTADSLRHDPRACQDFFARLVRGSDGLYHSMGIHNTDGQLICNAVTWQGEVNVKDRRYFRLAAQARKFAVGDYQIGRATGLAGINFGYPVIDNEKKLAGVVFAALDLKKMNELMAKTPLPRGGMLTVFDLDGVVLAQQPAITGGTGQAERNPMITEAIRTAETQVFEGEDAGGVQRLFAIQRAGLNPDGRAPLHVVMSIPTRDVFADANKALLQTVVGIIIATLALVFGAWYGVELAILKRLRALLAVTNHIRAGDLSARTHFPPSEEDLCQLGNALDDMAQALQKRDADLKHALRELSEQVITDPLTRLNNRRYLWDFLGRDLIRARRAVLPVAAILFDIDHFKRFNDTWGHEAGDLVLKSVADVIRQNVRGSDIACRYGGEEFIVILSESTRTVALQRAETIRQDIEKLELMFGDKPLDRVTASFGVALYPTHADNAEALVRAADDALYRAKDSGRNRVHVFEAAPSLL